MFPDGLVPSEAKVRWRPRDSANPELPDGLAPSEAKVHWLPGNNGLKARKSTGLAARIGEGVSLLPLLRFLQEMKLN